MSSNKNRSSSGLTKYIESMTRMNYEGKLLNSVNFKTTNIKNPQTHQYSEKINIPIDFSIHSSDYFNLPKQLDNKDDLNNMSIPLNQVQTEPSDTINWARRISGILNNINSINMIGLDNGDFCIVGYCNNNLSTYNYDNQLEYTINNATGSFLFIIKYNFSGTIKWIRKIIGSLTNEHVKIIHVNNGDICITGNFFKNLYVYNDSDGTQLKYMIKSNTYNDTYIIKYSSNGEPLYVRTLSGNNDDRPVSIISTDDGDIYVTGTYSSNPLYIYNDSSNSHIEYALTNDGSYDVFIIKYDSSCNFKWARTIRGTSSDYPINMIKLDNNSICVSGVYTDSSINVFTDYSNSRVGYTLYNSGATDIFIIKYNFNSDVEWVRKIGGSGSDRSVNMISMGNGDFCITGCYSTLLKIYSDSSGTELERTLNSNNQDIFIIKYNSFGKTIWTRRIGGYGDDFPICIVKSDDMGVCITGHYWNKLNVFTDSSGVNLGYTLDYSNNKDTFLIKYASDGEVKWVRRIAGSGDEIPVDMIILNNGNIYVTGFFSNNIYIYNDISGSKVSYIYNNNNNNYKDVFIVKYTPDGIPIKVNIISGSSNDTPVGIIKLNTTSFCVVGYYDSNILTIYKNSSTSDKMFILDNKNNIMNAFIVKYTD